GALLLATAIAGWRPAISPRRLAGPAMLSACFLIPMVAFSLFAPHGAGGSEVIRRLSMLQALLSWEPWSRWSINLVEYLGSWGSLLATIVAGPGFAQTDLAGCALVMATIVFLAVRAWLPGRGPRRGRLETGMLVVVASVWLLVTMFYREHAD